MLPVFSQRGRTRCNTRYLGDEVADEVDEDDPSQLLRVIIWTAAVHVSDGDHKSSNDNNAIAIRGVKPEGCCKRL